MRHSGLIFLTLLLLQACGGGSNTTETTAEEVAEPEEEIIEEEMGAPIIGVCIWDKAAVRAEASKSGKYLSGLSLGETVVLLGETKTDAGDNDREYIKVSLSDDTEGWVSSYLIAQDAGAAAIQEKSSIYKRPDLLTATGDAFEPLEFVAIVSYGEDNWIEVIGNKRKKSGWIKGDGLAIGDENIALATLYSRAMEIEDQAAQQEAIKEITTMEEFKYASLMPLLTGNVDSYSTQETVEVDNMEALIAAIQPYTKVIIKPGTYNISAYQNEVDQYGGEYYTGDKEQYAFLEEGGLSIRQVNNLIIEGAGGGKTHLVTENGWIPVITLQDCEQVSIQGLRLGHDVEKGYCSGSVLSVNASRKVTSQNNILYGSGTLGYEIYETSDFVSTNNEILECTNGIMYLSGGSNVTFSGDTYHYNESYSEFIGLHSMKNVTFSDCVFDDNTGQAESQRMFSMSESNGIRIEDCSFSSNTPGLFVETDGDVGWEMGYNVFSGNGFADQYDGQVEGR